MICKLFSSLSAAGPSEANQVKKSLPLLNNHDAVMFDADCVLFIFVFIVFLNVAQICLLFMK